MTKLFQKEAKVRKASKNRPKSLILHVPPVIRDFLELEFDNDILLEACIEETGETYVKLRKKNRLMTLKGLP